MTGPQEAAQAWTAGFCADTGQEITHTTAFSCYPIFSLFFPVDKALGWIFYKSPYGSRKFPLWNKQLNFTGEACMGCGRGRQLRKPGWHPLLCLASAKPDFQAQPPGTFLH
jgi:hypothetical protein